MVLTIAKLRAAWADIIEERGNFKDADKDGVSHIIYEWMKGKSVQRCFYL